MRHALAVALLVAMPAIARPGEVVRVEHRDPSTLPSRGPTHALVTIEVFFAPQPGVNMRPLKYLEDLQARHPSQVRLVYRVLGANGSARLPYAALEAQTEGRFFEFLDVLARERQNPNDAKLLELGRQAGLDPVRLDAAIHHPPLAYERVIADNDRRRKQRLGSGGLPNALFNDRLPKRALSSAGPENLVEDYMAAKLRAEELIDRGADPANLPEAFDAESQDSGKDIVVQPGPTDPELDEQAGDPVLASPPLRTRGFPSYGSPEAPVTILVLCNPVSLLCKLPITAAQMVQDSFPDQVRIVWAPYFDVANEGAGDLGLLADAALCAERVGTSGETDFDRPASPGWRWVDAMRDEATSKHRRLPADELIDKIADRLHVDRRAFDRCRAQLAGTALAWIETARRSGVHTTPATVVGGRIYGPITDYNTLQSLVEAERAPGDCNVEHGCLHLGDFAPAWRDIR